MTSGPGQNFQGSQAVHGAFCLCLLFQGMPNLFLLTFVVPDLIRFLLLWRLLPDFSFKNINGGHSIDPDLLLRKAINI